MNRIEQEKIRIKNEINNRIRDINISLNRIEDSLSNLTKSNLAKDFVEKSKNKNKELQEKLLSELEDLNCKLSTDLEEEIKCNLVGNKTYSTELRDTQAKNKKIKDEEQIEKANKSKVIWQSQKDEFHKVKNMKRDMDREYYHMLHAIDSLPAYIQKNLKEMPNNKGYIFKGVYHFGHLPAEEGQPTVFFEKNRDGSLLIHEWHSNKRKIFLKDHNGNKKLIKEEIRKKVKDEDNFGNNIIIKTIKKK